MAKFTINPRVVYSGDNCYVTIAALIVISQSSYSLLSWGLGHLRCLVDYSLDYIVEGFKNKAGTKRNAVYLYKEIICKNLIVFYIDQFYKRLALNIRIVFNKFTHRN